MHGDGRSRRVAVVSDSVVNPAPGEPDHLAALAADGWGVIALPPNEAAEAVKAELLAAIVDEVVTFLDDGYEVVCACASDEDARLFHAALASSGRRIRRTTVPASP